MRSWLGIIIALSLLPAALLLFLFEEDIDAFFRALPTWVHVVIVAVGAVLWVLLIRWEVRRSRARRRARRGLCIAWYDLRGSPDRCPECGAGLYEPRAGGTDKREASP